MQRAFLIFRLLSPFLLSLFASCSNDDAPTPGRTCSQASDCKKGLTCALGRCRNECKESRDCGLGGSCITDGTRALCQLLKEKEEGCGGPDDCQAPLACATDYRCRNLCSKDGDCNILGISGRFCAEDMRGVHYCAEPSEVEDGRLVAAPPADALKKFGPMSWPNADGGNGAGLDAGPGIGTEPGGEGGLAGGDGGGKGTLDGAASGDAEAGSAPLTLMAAEVASRLPHDASGNISIAVASDSTGRPYILTRSSTAQGGLSLLSKLESGDGLFTPIGPAVSDRPLLSTPALAFDAQDVPFVALQQRNDADTATEIVLRRFDGTSWQPLAGPLAISNSNTDYRPQITPSLTFDPQGHPIVMILSTYAPGVVPAPQVWRAEMGSWTQLGSVDSVAQVTDAALMISPAGDPYLALSFPQRGYEVWRSAGGRWLPMTTVRSSTTNIFSAGLSMVWFEAGPALAINDNNTIHVAHFDGSQWLTLPLAPVTPAVESSVLLTVINGELLLLLRDQKSSTASLYRHRDGKWQPELSKLGPAIDSSGFNVRPYALTSRAGYTYLGYATSQFAGLVRLSRP
ncbi:MAG: hypothetical protein RLZZ450_6052 [Pseudomonadota bacterium]|jgi:hypothetical protein